MGRDGIEFFRHIPGQSVTRLDGAVRLGSPLFQKGHQVLPGMVVANETNSDRPAPLICIRKVEPPPSDHSIIHSVEPGVVTPGRNSMKSGMDFSASIVSGHSRSAIFLNQHVTVILKVYRSETRDLARRINMAGKLPKRFGLVGVVAFC